MRILQSLLLLLIMSLPVFAQQQEAGIVLSVSGDVRLENNGTTQSGAVRMIVYQNDTVITGADGRVQILFKDDTIMSLSPDTELDLVDYHFDSEGDSFAVTVLQGVARVVTGEIVKRNPEKFTVSTPHTSISIRGTTVTTLVLPTGTSAIVNDATAGFPVVMTSAVTNETISADVTGMVLHTNINGDLSIREATPEEMRLSQLVSPSLAVESEAQGIDSRNELVNTVIGADMLADDSFPTTASFSGGLQVLDPSSSYPGASGTVSFNVNMVSGAVSNFSAYITASGLLSDSTSITQNGALSMNSEGDFISDSTNNVMSVSSEPGDLAIVDGVSVFGNVQGDRAQVAIELYAGGTYTNTTLSDTGLQAQ